MRQIKASEIRPGMEVEWTSVGVTRKCVASTVDSASPRYGVNLHTSEGGLVHIPGNAEVTVLDEPYPEEPTAFGARVVAGGYEFLLSNGGRRPWKARLDGNRYSWAEVCGLGPVTIIDADPSWTLPAQVKVEVPAAPERIEEWPEDDEHLRAYRWADEDGGVWRHTGGGWQMGRSIYVKDTPRYGPWTRVTDA